jgi:hypothetical protein
VLFDLNDDDWSRSREDGILRCDLSIFEMGRYVLDGVSLDQFRTVIAAVDEGSFSAAARKPDRVQSAVSGWMGSLDGRCGLGILSTLPRRNGVCHFRLPPGVGPTGAGRQMAHRLFEDSGSYSSRSAAYDHDVKYARPGVTERVAVKPAHPCPACHASMRSSRPGWKRRTGRIK